MGGEAEDTIGRAHASRPSDVCLVVMLKSPERAKSRLTACLGDLGREAAEHLWACAHEDAAEWRGPRCFAPASESDRAWLERWMGRNGGHGARDGDTDGDGECAGTEARAAPLLLVQPEGNLGARINFIDAGLHSRGFEKQIFIGTDCPELTSIYLERAARLLDDHDAVLGPAQDGGVVLMAARRAWPPLGALPWSRADLGAALEALLRGAGWSVALLETLADVDSAQDLGAAADRLRGDARPERRALVAWIERRGLGLRGGLEPGSHGRPGSDGAFSPGVALVVPVRDDTEHVSALLEGVATWTHAPAEVIVVSAGVDRALESLCLEHRARLIVAAPNRGAQMDAGARAASAPVLWFVHADAALPPGGLHAIGGALANGAVGGCFRFAFQGEAAWYKWLLARLVGLRVRLGGIPYGDQGLFVRRDVYLACGGFPHQPLFEEVRLVTRLRRRGAFRPLPVPIGVSPRRWERDGWWRRTLRNRWLALRYMLGASAESLSRVYHGPLDAATRREA